MASDEVPHYTHLLPPDDDEDMGILAAGRGSGSKQAKRAGKQPASDRTSPTSTPSRKQSPNNELAVAVLGLFTYDRADEAGQAAGAGANAGSRELAQGDRSTESEPVGAAGDEDDSGQDHGVRRIVIDDQCFEIVWYDERGDDEEDEEDSVAIEPLMDRCLDEGESWMDVLFQPRRSAVVRRSGTITEAPAKRESRRHYFVRSWKYNRELDKKSNVQEARQAEKENRRMMLARRFSLLHLQERFGPDTARVREVDARNAHGLRGLDARLRQALLDLQFKEITPEDYDLLLSLDATVKPKALSTAQIRSLPTVKYATTAEGEIEMCSICMDAFEDGDVLRRLPCGHRFHGVCIEQWLAGSERCPADNLKVFDS